MIFTIQVMLRTLSSDPGELRSALMPGRSFPFSFLYILNVRKEEIFEGILSCHCAHFTLTTGSSKQDSQIPFNLIYFILFSLPYMLNFLDTASKLRTVAMFVTVDFKTTFNKNTCYMPIGTVTFKRSSNTFITKGIPLCLYHWIINNT
jgi:hypothetical protein